MRFGGRILGSTSARGAYRAVLIEAGKSLNGVTYPAEMLRQAASAGLFEGRPGMCYAKVDADGVPIRDHIKPVSLVGGTPLNTAVVFKNTRWDESLQAVVGDMHVLTGTETGDELDAHLRALEQAGAIETFGLSIDGEGPVDQSGRVTLAVINSVDVVTRPAAGGRVLHRIAASRGFGAPSMRTLFAILAATHARLVEGYKGAASNAFGIARHIASRAKADAAVAEDLHKALGGTGEAKRFTEAKDEIGLIAEISDFCARLVEAEQEKVAKDAETARAAEAARQAAAAKPPTPPAGDTPPNAEDCKAIADLKQQMHETRVAESRTRLSAAADAAKLPAKAKAALLLQHGGRVLEAGEETRIVEAQRAVIDDAIAAAGGGVATIVRESADRTRDLLAHAFNPTQVPAPKEGAPAYVGDGVTLFERHIFGGVRLTEALYGGDAGRRRLREAIDSTTSAKTLQDAMNIALLAAYRSNDLYSQWEKIVRKVSLSSFRTHNVVKVPYYSNLPVVLKGAPYTVLTTPTETQEQITLVKYGGVETILLEDLINGDFLDIWQQRLQRLGQAAMETRSEIVHALHRDATMPTMAADSTTLTSSSRSPVNEGTAALTGDATGVTNFWASVAAMMASTGGSGVAKGLLPRYIVIPRAKMAAWAYIAQSFAGGMSGVNVPEGLQKILKLAVPEAIIDVRTSNTTDWYLFADPNVAEVLRFGELAGRGGPRIDIADALTFGAMFTNDGLEAKISDVFAAAATDFAGIYGNDAAS